MVDTTRCLRLTVSLTSSDKRSDLGDPVLFTAAGVCDLLPSGNRSLQHPRYSNGRSSPPHKAFPRQKLRSSP